MLLQLTTVLVLITLIPVHNCEGTYEEWNSPHFSRPENAIGIKFIQRPENTQYTISVQEELPFPFKLAVINYNGESEPEIGSFIAGNNDLLGAEIKKENNKWYIIINRRQDYENPKQRYYTFDIDIKNFESQTIVIVLENIFDNPPSITYDSPCSVEELKSNFKTDCTFHVYDEDTMKDNNITFKIVGQHNENELFKLKIDDYVTINEYQRDYKLYVIKELHYEERTSYNFKIFVYDAVCNSGNMTAIVEVIDMPNMDPKWTKPFITATFNEKTSQEFSVKAIDGDTGINKRIEYRLEFNKNEDYSKLMKINKTTGILHINPIDRDKLKKEIFSFKICAYKFDNLTWAVCDTPAIIVQDINDNLPEITIQPIKIQLLENKFGTIPFEEFFIDDIDLGIHATYNVSLSQFDNRIKYSEAFDIIPDAGYQKTDFRITVKNASLLDYDNIEENWKNFLIIIIAQELDLKEHRTQANLDIELINWNDELPIFDKDVYEFDVSEIIGINQIIAKVHATDRDIDDRIEYEIVGMVEGLTIDKDNGSVITTLDRTFDHERQTSVIVQIKAHDTLIALPTDKIHSVYTQLMINVIDVNDKTPEIRMPRKTPHVVENSPANTLVTNEIIATDPDTTANLTFYIDWTNSYATKSGQEAEKETYEGCFYIERKKETINKVYGLLKINPDFHKDVDYEMYDTIYLTIRVTDENQEYGEPSTEGILTIRIDDVNDNRPEFILDTLNEARIVSEEAEKNVIIGTIHAVDIDGPPFNIFNYTIRPVKSNSIPPIPIDLIEIHNETGIIRVINGKKIDCDVPKREYLYYTVTLNDGIPPNTEGEIKIRIKDINNKKPQIGNFRNPVQIKEKSPDETKVGKIFATDLDRDHPHNLLQYSIDFKLFPDLKNFFEINTTTGDIYVKLLGNNILDRDLGKSTHEIHVNVDDNYMGNGVTNSNKTTLTVILLDINDHAPELPETKNFKPQVKENAEKNFLITNIEAPDIDEPNTPNSWVSYKILGIKPGPNQPNDIKNYEKLFRIESNDKKTGQIYVNQELKGYYGEWYVEIQAHDHGDEGPDKKQMSSQEIYTFNVIPYNFHNPEIIYPKSEDFIRLSYRGQQIGIPLLTAEGKQLRSFEAYDADGDDCGNVTFIISSYDSTSQDSDYFQIYKESRHKSRLQIAKDIQPRRYHINLIAEDEASTENGGKKKSEEIKNLIISFIDMASEPYFEKNEFNTEFTEKDEGLLEERIIPEAIDPKNEGIQNENEKVKVFYFINNKYNPNDTKLFSLDKTKRVLKLLQPLNRLKQKTHTIQIITTNREDGPKANQEENSLLLIHVKVQGPPNFDEKTYGAGITTSDYTGKVILTIHASSSNNIISYQWNKSDIIANGENLENIKTKILNLNNQNGNIVLQEPPLSTMKGYFQFNVTAIDDMKRTDIANIKIYIVTEANRIKFVFNNDYEYVIKNSEYLKNSLKEVFDYDMCNIDEILKGNSDDNNDNDKQKSLINNNDVDDYDKHDITTIRVHFIKNNEAVDASEIQSKSSDISLFDKLKRKLNSESLYLNDITQPNSNTNLSNQIQNIQIILLSVISTVLFIICISLIVAYVLRVKAINRQIKAFTIKTDFITNNSNNINPFIINDKYNNNINNDDNNNEFIEKISNKILSENNNIFTIEKHNPILNENNEIDKMYTPEADSISNFSSYSNESDFTGIQNDPIFLTENYVDGINPKIFAKRLHFDKHKDTDA